MTCDQTLGALVAVLVVIAWFNAVWRLRKWVLTRQCLGCPSRPPVVNLVAQLVLEHISLVCHMYVYGDVAWQTSAVASKT